jgi:hypothetical protein
VHHLDGFGTRAEKNATFNRLYRPGRFNLGYKLFYDEDVGIYTPPRCSHFSTYPTMCRTSNGSIKHSGRGLAFQVITGTEGKSWSITRRFL